MGFIESLMVGIRIIAGGQGRAIILNQRARGRFGDQGDPPRLPSRTAFLGVSTGENQ